MRVKHVKRVKRPHTARPRWVACSAFSMIWENKAVKKGVKRGRKGKVGRRRG